MEGWDEVFGRAADGVRALAVELAAGLRQRHPDLIETAVPGYRSVVFGWPSGRMKDGIFYLMPHDRWLNLGFYRGAERDHPRLEGTGKTMRHVKLRTKADLDDALFALVADFVRLGPKA